MTQIILYTVRFTRMDNKLKTLMTHMAIVKLMINLTLLLRRRKYIQLEYYKFFAKTLNYMDMQTKDTI